MASTSASASSWRSANSGPIWRAVRPSRTSATALAVRHQARAGAAGKFRRAARRGQSPWLRRSRAIKCGTQVASDCAAPRCVPSFQPQPPQLQRRREAERAVDVGPAGVASSQVVRPSSSRRRGRRRPAGRDAAAAPARGHQHHADPGVAGGVGQQRRGRDQWLAVADPEHDSLARKNRQSASFWFQCASVDSTQSCRAHRRRRVDDGDVPQ